MHTEIFGRMQEIIPLSIHLCYSFIIKVKVEIADSVTYFLLHVNPHILKQQGFYEKKSY